MSTMTTSYEVIDEELSEAAQEAGATKAAKKPAKSADESADEVAALVKEMAGEAAKIATNAALEGGQKLVSKYLADCEAKIKALSDQYAKPRDLCLAIKFGDMKAVKLKTRTAKILPELMVQAEVARKHGGNWPLLQGPTGSGKTHAAGQLAEALKLPFGHINCTEGMSETWIFGRQTPTGFVAGEFFTRYKEGGVFLFDEFDAANENVVLAVNTALSNGHLYNPMNGESVKRHPDFICVAATNTNGKGGTGAYTGRSRLDGAALNRFTQFLVSYDCDLERDLCPDKKLLQKLWEIRVELEKKASQDVISTRDIRNAYLQAQAGFDLGKILGCLKLRMDKSNHSLFEVKG